MPHYPERILQDRPQPGVVQLIETAETLSQSGNEDALPHRERSLENASRVIDRWASSPGLRAPN